MAIKRACGFSLYGLLGGPPGHGGLGYSLGMDMLRGKVRALGVTVPPSFDYTSWEDVSRQVNQVPADVLVFLWGHSFGANAMTWIANGVHPRQIDYMAAFDPSVTTIGQRAQPVKANVRIVLSIQGTGMSIPGHGHIDAEEGNTTTKITHVQDPQRHTDIDDNAGLHGMVLKTMRQLMGLEALVA